MRSGVVLLLVSAVALSVLSGAAGSRSSQRLVPSAVAFSDRSHGILGLASPHCTGCAPRGAIATTSDAGKTWHIVVRTPRRVVAAGYYNDGYDVSLEGHGSLWTDGAGRWHRSSKTLSFSGHCPKGWNAGSSADLVDANIDRPWSICLGMPGTGFQAKAVYRGSKRVACTNFMDSHFACGAHSRGGIGGYGYPAGIAGAHGGFGIIWPGARGSVYVTRDGGRHWHAVPIAVSDLDSGTWATTAGNSGFVLLWREGHSRLVETTDAGRTWHVVHRWR
jgi:hypothetical protein